MFKAKLIENDNYYKFRSKQLWLWLLPGIPASIFINFSQFPLWLNLLMAGIYILIFFFLLKNQKRLTAKLGNKILEIDEQEIRIKSGKGVQKEAIRISDVNKLIVKEKYSIPADSMKEMRKEMIGETKKNYIILEQENQKRQLDFEIDSNYMIKQLDKLIANWKLKGYNIVSQN